MARARLPLNRVKATHMPPVCIICGGPVDAHIPRTFTWRPQWMSLGFWISVFFCLPAAVVIVAVGILSTRRVTVECPMCDRHRHYFAWRGFWIFVPLLVLVIAVITMAMLIVLRRVPEEAFGYMFIVTAVLLIVWAITATIIQHNSLKATEITEDDVILAPVHAAFTELLQIGRRRQKTAPDFGWEEYDPYPRSKDKNAIG